MGKRPVGVEDLDAVGDGVERRDPPVGADGDGGRSGQPSVRVPIPTNGVRERPVGVEDLDATGGGVGHGSDSRLQAMRRKDGGGWPDGAARSVDR